MDKDLMDLLLKDLCGRLPYKVKIEVTYSKDSGSSLRARLCSEGINTLNTNILGIFQQSEIYIKPYLFPLSSMTEEQDREFSLLQVNTHKDGFLYVCDCTNMITWLNKNHFDYRNLIPKGLAIDCTGLNIYV